MGRGNFGLEGRYDHGLTNLNKDVEEEEDFEVRSRAFTFVVKIWLK